MIDDKPFDEWNLIPILKKHNAEGALPEIEKELDKFCGSYIKDSEAIRVDAFIEISYFLNKALYEDSAGKRSLRDSMKEIVRYSEDARGEVSE